MNRYTPSTHSFRFALPAFVAMIVWPAAADDDQSINPPDAIMNKPSPVLSPEEALESFQIEDGFEIQVVAAEPLIEDPVCMTWDADGRLWVCEMRGYMPNQKAEGEEEPTGMIVILEDTDGDGKMDKRTEFMTDIVLPRAIAMAKNGVLYADYKTLYYVRINSDGSAGARMPIDPNYANNGGAKSNVEHQANGLLYGLDNWYYNAKSSRRYRQLGARFRRGETEFRGQWGITQDDDGRLLANRNPVLIQWELFPPSATRRNENLKKFNAGPAVLAVKPDVYPIHPTPGVNRAYRPNTVDHTTWKLKVATAACGPVIYRADQFPEDYYNNVFIPEPAGNLLKRVVLKDNGKEKPSAEQAYDNKEFLASTDERNRFVNAYVGPDGCLYLVDMYRGLIQHKTYITDYLRRQIAARDLEKPLGYGRIYRVVYKGNPVDHKPPKLTGKTSAELVDLLGHSNAWYRETAQRLLVQRDDADAVALLDQVAMTSANPQARIHALWALEGMGELKAAVLLAAGGFDNERVRIQVLRLAEAFAGETEAKVFVSLMEQYDNDPSWEMDLQLAFSAGALASIDTPGAYDVLLGVLERRGDQTLFRHAVISGLQGKEAVMLAKVGDGPIKQELTGAVLKSVESGDLTIGALLALIDSEAFADQRESLLANLAEQSVEQEREEVVRLLIDRMSAEDASVATQRTILRGMIEGRNARGNPAELDGKPELFAKWMDSPPEQLADLVAELGNVFVFEKTVISDEVAERIAMGKMHFAAKCASCHNADGTGLSHTAPPLTESEWVNLHPKALAMLVLNGVEGDIEVNGTLYKAQVDHPGFMPAQKEAVTSDEDLANILTYIRSREMNNNGGEVTPEDVAEVRASTANRKEMFTPAKIIEIDALMRGEAPPTPSGPDAHIVHAGWLHARNLGLLLTLLGVSVPLVVLLVLTIFGGGRPAMQPAH